MGGFAVQVDWSAAADPRPFDRMVEAMTHRGTAGIRTTNEGPAHLAEARFPRDGTGDWQIATLGPLTLVGDLRLWDLDALRAIARTDAHDPRAAVLHAYAARGSEILDTLDGDFTFAIWDSDTQRLFAARDRFGVKPLWMQLAPHGIRLASGVEQLVAAADTPPGPDRVTISRFLEDEVPWSDRSFREGITRLMPAHHLVATSERVTTTRYWDVATIPERPTADVPGAYLTLLVDAVANRLADSHRAVSDLSGGLDSSAIAAAAHSLVPNGLDADRLVTVSAIVPGESTDESAWIAATVACQPFPHREFTPRIASIDDYATDMAATGAPIAHHLRDLAVRTAEIAAEEGADLVLTGNGGDEVADDRWVLAHLLRTGHPVAWSRRIRSMSATSPYAAALWAVSSLGQSLPPRVRRALRGKLPTRSDAGRSTRHRLADGLANGRGLLVLEWLEAMFARAGLEVSHPFLDRRLVEFVASIPATARTVGVGNKALTREAFRDALPALVVDRVEKVTGNDYIDQVTATQGEAFAVRFPDVTDAASPWVDPVGYRDTLGRFAQAQGPDAGVDLWPTWSLMLWLDTFGTSAT